MKIIVNNLKKEYPKKCICQNCTSIIEIDESDVKKITVEDFDIREKESYKYQIKGFLCPVCHKETKIIESK